jgi:excisionase family DNA binding protein
MDTLTIPEIMRRLACSRSAAYALTSGGALPIVRLGRAVRVPVAALDRFIESGGVAVMPLRGAKQTKRAAKSRGRAA